MTGPKVVARLRASYLPRAECRDDIGCGWARPSGLGTREEAKRHALATGHEVEVIAEDVTVYERVDG